MGVGLMRTQGRALEFVREMEGPLMGEDAIRMG